MVKLAVMLCCILLEEGLKSKRPGLRVVVIRDGDTPFVASSRVMMPQRFGVSADFTRDGHGMFETLWDPVADTNSSTADMLSRLAADEQSFVREHADTMSDNVLHTIDMCGNGGTAEIRPPELHISFSSPSVMNVILLAGLAAPVRSEPAIVDPSQHAHAQLAC